MWLDFFHFDVFLLSASKIFHQTNPGASSHQSHHRPADQTAFAAVIAENVKEALPELPDYISFRFLHEPYTKTKQYYEFSPALISKKEDTHKKKL